MATIAIDTNGHKGIQFVGLSGKRQEFRLGKATQKQAEAVLAKVESILSDLRIGRPHDAEVSDWIRGLHPTLLNRMQRVGLVGSGVGNRMATLGELLDAYFGSLQVKETTATVYSHTKRNLLSFFGADRQVRSIGPEEGEGFRQYLSTVDKGRGKGKFSRATINRRVRIARTVFAKAVRLKFTDENPFAYVKAGDQTNRDRQYYLSREDAEKLMQACPDSQWRLLVALSRYGGLRVPSEPLLLKWSDMDLEKRTILVHSPKTEHHKGQEQRLIPLFPELEKPILDVFAEAEEGSEWVITHCPTHRDPKRCNFGTHLKRIIKRAKLTAWPKVFHNMRASCETDLARLHPIKAVCEWLGNSSLIAAKHYLQVTNADFERAANPPQIPPQQTAASGGTDGKAKESPKLIVAANADECLRFSTPSSPCFPLSPVLMGAVGFEPT